MSEPAKQKESFHGLFFGFELGMFPGVDHSAHLEARSEYFPDTERLENRRTHEAQTKISGDKPPIPRR